MITSVSNWSFQNCCLAEQTRVLAIACCATIAVAAAAQAPALAEQPPPKQVMRIGDEVVDLESGKSFVKAQEFLTANQFDQAAPLFKQFLDGHPDSAVAHYKYGFVLLQQNKNAEALQQAQRCTELKPGFFAGWALLGETSMNLKLDVQARQAYEKALAIQSTGENADIIREHLNDLNKPKEAPPVETAENQQIALQNRIAMKVNKALSLCNQANDMLKQKQFEPGLQKCRSALTIAPDSEQVRQNVVAYLNNYAADCVQKQSLKQAEELMKEAVALQSKGGCTAASRITTLKNYSALLNYLGRNDEAKQIQLQMQAISR